MSITVYGGVDFDLGGALALLFVDSERGVVRCEVHDTPIVERKGARREYDVEGIVSLVSKSLDGEKTMFSGAWAGGVLVELAQALPSKMGGTFANFLRGRGSAAWEAALASVGVRRDMIAPAAWKKSLGLTGGPKGKKESIAKAKALVPLSAHYYKLAKDHGRAEAVLLAYLAMMRWGKI